MFISIKKDPVSCKKSIAYVPDNPDIYPNLRGIDYLNFICDMYEVPLSERTSSIGKYANIFSLTSSLAVRIISLASSSAFSINSCSFLSI